MHICTELFEIVAELEIKAEMLTKHLLPSDAKIP